MRDCYTWLRPVLLPNLSAQLPGSLATQEAENRAADVLCREEEIVTVLRAFDYKVNAVR